MFEVDVVHVVINDIPKLYRVSLFQTFIFSVQSWDKTVYNIHNPFFECESLF